MKFCALLLLISCTISLSVSEYPRYKVRGPPRPPPMPQYAKKWQQNLPRGPAPVRSRPIPVHMPTSHKIPLGGGMPSNNRVIAPPVRNFWKNTQTQSNFKIPNEKPIAYLPVPSSEKNHFLSSPTITTQEYDLHVQSNSIPTHTNPIKQVGEKGPIHTIPAPNLSLADKPIVVEDGRQETTRQHQQQQPHQQQQQQSTYFNIQKSHQYQVTEQPELLSLPNQKSYRNQQQIYYAPNYDTASLQQSQNAAVFQSSNNAQILPVQSPSQSELYSISGEDQLGVTQINQKELYQLLSAYPNQQQIHQETYAMPSSALQQQQQQHQQQQLQQQQLQQQYLQQQQNSNYQALLTQQPQLFQPDHNYVQQLQQNIHQTASDKISIQPEYHSFNYEEPTKTIPSNRKAQPTKKELSSLVTATYNLEPSKSTEAQLHTTMSQSRNSMDAALAQAQYVQNYFANNREDNISENDVEPDAKPSEDMLATMAADQKRNEDPGESPDLYSLLPNKEAAVALASLQAAGKMNSNLLQMVKQSQQGHNKEKGSPMTIYVPDDFDSNSSSSKENNQAADKVKSDDFKQYEDDDAVYEDYSQEDMLSQEENLSVREAFGQRLKPKRN